jgi:TonB family protein
MYFLQYILESGACAALLWAAYYCLLCKEPCLMFNRFYLLSVIPFSLLVPLLQLPLLPAAGGTAAVIAGAPEIAGIAVPEGGGFSFVRLLLPLYAVGAGCCFFRFVRKLYMVLKTAGHNRFPVPAKYTAFTFFRKIYVNRNTLSATDYEKVLLHEQTHARQLHSIDLLFAELFIIVQWFNPFAWKLKQSLAEVHEYLADAQVIARGVDPEKYQQLLYSQAAGIYPEYVSGFSYSLTKKRLIMITKKTHSKWMALKFAGLLVAAAAPVAMFGLTTEKATPIPAQVTGITGNLADMTAVEKDTVDSAKKTPVRKSSIVYTIKKDAVSDSKRDSVTAPEHATPPTENGYDNELDKTAFLSDKIDKQPEYPGGMEALYKFIGRELKYPPEEQQNGVQGRVTLQFVIDADGSVKNVKTLRGVTSALDAEAVRVIKLLPKWTPGESQGKPVAVKYVMPIVFSINEKEPEQKPFSVDQVEVAPEFPGGMEALFAFIMRELKYPPEERQNGIEGRVTLQFVIAADGSVKDVTVLRGATPALDAEAVRVIKLLPKWTPGENKGKPVDVNYVMPIIFNMK